MGSPCFLQSPCHRSFFASSSSSSSPFIFSPRIAQTQKNLRPSVALVRAEAQNGPIFCNRRLVLFVGISVLPLLQLRARALEVSLADIPEMKAAEQKPEEDEQSIHRSESQNPFLSLLNGIGFYGSGALAALYALARKQNGISDAALQSIRGELEEKEATIVSMRERFESELLKEQDEKNKQLKTASEEQQVLLNRLSSTNRTINDLELEVQKEKKFVEELRVAKNRLEDELRIAGEEKEKLQAELEDKLGSIQEKMNLLSLEIKDKEGILQTSNAKLVEKEDELNQLRSLYQQSQSALLDLTSENQKLKDEILRKTRELEFKKAEVDGLEVQLNALIVERNELNIKIDALQNDFNNLKTTSENKATSDAQLLDEQQRKLQQLQKQLDMASDEVNQNKVLITDLTLQQVNLKNTLDMELETGKNLKQELHIAQENLESSRNETSDLKNRLEQSRKLCSGLEEEVSMVRSDIVKTRDALQKNIDEAKKGAELLAMELTSTKELLKKSNEELQTLTQELALVSDTRDTLQKELIDVYKKAESATNDLKEERNIVATLNKELQVLESHILRDKEAHKSLEEDLEDTTKSLVEMNQKAMVLSKDLELATSTISRLEDEKQMLYKSLTEQKQVSQEARENMEDAHNLVMRLGKERENLEKRAKKLEEELGSAKGEILRLRSQMNSSNTPVDDEQDDKVKVADKATVSSRRYIKRRKPVAEQDDS